MGIASAWRGDALNDMLSKPAFAPVQAKKRAPKPSKYSEETEAQDYKPTASPRLGNTRKVKGTTPHEPAPWTPSKSPMLRDLGYTMTTDDLKPGMNVSLWNAADPARTIDSVNHVTQNATEITYTDGATHHVTRNASFALGIPPQNRV